MCCWSVGLAQREIEAAGITTITLSGIPDLTASVSVPRLAGIEYPLGYLFGLPGDREGQTEVLRAVLKALEEAQEPGTVIHLPFEWPEEYKKMNANPTKQPPITKHLAKNPWQIPYLFSREVPPENTKNERKQNHEKK